VYAPKCASDIFPENTIYPQLCRKFRFSLLCGGRCLWNNCEIKFYYGNLVLNDVKFRIFDARAQNLV